MDEKKILSIAEANAYVIESMGKMLTEFCSEDNITERELPLDFTIRKVNRNNEVAEVWMRIQANKDKFGLLKYLSGIIMRPFPS